MANHRAEDVIAKVETLVTGLATTGSNVERGRFYPFAEDVAAGLTVRQGQFTPVGDGNVAYQDGDLEVIVTAHAKGADDTVESTINQIAKEVYVALLASHTLGLAYVHQIEWRGNDEPQLGAAEQPVVSMDMRFAVQLRHSYTDPSA